MFFFSTASAIQRFLEASLRILDLSKIRRARSCLVTSKGSSSNLEKNFWTFCILYAFWIILKILTLVWNYLEFGLSSRGGSHGHTRSKLSIDLRTHILRKMWPWFLAMKSQTVLMVFLFSKILQCTPGRDTKTTVLSGDAIVFEILKHQRQKVDTFLIHDALSSIMESWNAWNITNTICNKRNRHVKFTELEDKS